MAQAPAVQGHSLYVRDQTLTPGTPFLQSECTSGYLCGAQFEQDGCYASPDYSTCQYDASQGASYCTTCICYGGSAGCDSSSAGTPAGSPPPPPGWTVSWKCDSYQEGPRRHYTMVPVLDGLFL